jgi:hypothetical protein
MGFLLKCQFLLCHIILKNVTPHIDVSHIGKQTNGVGWRDQ